MKFVRECSRLGANRGTYFIKSSEFVDEKNNSMLEDSNFHMVYVDLSCIEAGTLMGWEERVKFLSSEIDARRCISELEEESEKAIKSECTQIEPNQVLYAPYYFVGVYMQFPQSKYSTEDEIRMLGEYRDVFTDGMRTEELEGYVIFERKVVYSLFDDKDEKTGEPFVAVSKEIDVE